jgi:hypothetical protein
VRKQTAPNQKAQINIYIFTKEKKEKKEKEGYLFRVVATPAALTGFEERRRRGLRVFVTGA